MLLAAFRAARLRGQGASGCLTSGALGRYSDASCDAAALASSPGPLVLYRCGDHRVNAIPDAEIQVSTSDPRYLQYSVVLSGTNQAGGPPQLYEHVEIAPGVPVGASASAAQVIVDVTQD